MNQMPNEIDVAFQQAEKLRVENKIEEALSAYTKVVHMAPGHWPAYFYLGVLFAKKGKHDLSYVLLKRSEKFNPANAVIKNHISDALFNAGKKQEAYEVVLQSLELDSSSQNKVAYFKLGHFCWELNKPAEGLEALNKLLAFEFSENADDINLKVIGQWYRSLCLLSLGEYQQAWPDYEERNKIPGVIVDKPESELWTGQSLEGKSIYLVYEQRFGDVIQFVRFIPNLIQMGAKVIIQLPPELKKQIECSFPDVEIVLTGQPDPEHDYYNYATSIPAILNLSKQDVCSANAPYFKLAGMEKDYSLPVRNGTSLRVGLVWQGKPDPDRSIPLKEYLPLLEHPEVSFFSFQLGSETASLGNHSVGWLIHDLSGQITDFYDSSILLKEMDLLITIDTAIVHQAGALGVPTWLMLKYFSDWRWELNRSDNDWYPSLKIIRQHEEGSWKEAAKELQSHFAEWVRQNAKTKESGIKV